MNSECVTRHHGGREHDWAACMIGMCGALLLSAASFASEVPPVSPVPQFLQPRPVTRLEQPTQWTTCDWDVEKQDSLAECATVLVPLDYDNPARGEFRLFVKRRKVLRTPSAQVWLLHGGPGASATEGLKALSYDIPELRPDIVYYAVDHRGVGGSEKLECPAQQAEDSPSGSAIAAQEWPSCIAYLREAVGQRLNYFTTTLAARDVGTLVEKYRIANVPVFIYGGSYGTYLARRYLHFFPDQPAGVILEGIADIRDHMRGYDAAMIAAANELLEACARSAECASRFDGSPATAVHRALNSLDEGHCGQLKLTTAQAKAALTGMTFSATTRVLVPALARRIERCADYDVPVIAHALTTYLSLVSRPSYSSVLHNHVALSEMYTPGRDTDELQRQFDTAALSTGLELGYSRIYAQWPRYPRDSFVGREPRYDGPLLMLNGALDTPSPLPRALEVRETFDGKNQYWVVFPEGAHGMTSKTPTLDGSDCGRTIYLQFVNRREVAPDTSCLARIMPIDWNSTAATAMQFMGTTDIWDGAIEASAALPLRSERSAQGAPVSSR